MISTRTRLTRAVATVLLLSACSSTPPRQALIEGAANPRPMDGTVAVLTTLTGQPCDEQRDCAQRQAMRALLFTGIPDSPNSRPMVGDEAQALRQHKGFFENLLDRKGYTRYVVRVSDSAAAPGAPPASQSFTVLINTTALRTALEQAGVIRKFGY